MAQVFKIDYKKAVKEINKIAKRGFCRGIGDVGGKGKMCVEAAVSTALNHPEWEDLPKCVPTSLSEDKITLNDGFTKDKDRTLCLLPLAIAQLGSINKFDNAQWEEAYADARTKVGQDRILFLVKRAKTFEEASDLLETSNPEDWEFSLPVQGAIMLLTLKALKSPGCKHVKASEFARAAKIVKTFVEFMETGK